MQILVLSSKFPYPLKDGGAIATFQLFKGLSKLATTIHLLSFNTSKHHIDQQNIPSSYFPQGSYTLVNINTQPGYFKALSNLLLSSKPYILSRFKSKRFTKKLQSLLKTNQFDIVQIEGLYMLQYIKVIRENSDAKIAFRAHNLEYQIWKQLSENEKNTLKRKYLKLLSKRVLSYEQDCLNKYDMLLPISTEDADYYKQLGNSTPLKVIPTGFDFIVENKPLTNSNLNKLFYIGSLEWQPNQEGLLWFLENCWPVLVKKQAKLELHIAGRNAPKWLQQRFNQSGITYHGEVESSADFMLDNSIMIVPLLSGSGMRIKIIEAFIQNKAVVATGTAAKGIGAVHRENILIADEPEAFVEKIIQLTENQEVYNIQIMKAYSFAQQNFDNQKIIEGLFQFYQKNKERKK